MLERVQKRGVVISSGVFASIATLMLIKEWPLLIHHTHFSLYLLGRIGTLVILMLCVILALTEFEQIFTYYSLIFFFTALFYECHGQYFQPNYWLAYIQVTNIFPFIFYIDKRLLAGLFTFGLFCFDGVLITVHQSPEFKLQTNSISTSFFGDILTGTMISTVIAYTGASVFFDEKVQRNEMYQRFIDLGKNISSIVHDIKGMISGPCNYSDLLIKKATAGEFTPENSLLVTYLNEDILAVKEFVMEMNLLVATQSGFKDSPVKISDVIRSVKKIFRSKIGKINIDLIGDMTLKTKADYINRIIINSIINSCEAINKNGVKSGKITVFCEDYLLGISDNSGSKLNPATLKNLNNPYTSFTDKQEGSGLGVLIIKDYIKAIGGKYKYFNQINGVNLAIQFPKKIILHKIKSENRNSPL